MDKMKKEEPWCKKRPSFFADDGESQSNCYFLSSTLIATNVHVRCFDTSVITLPVPTPARPPARPPAHARLPSRPHRNVPVSRCCSPREIREEIAPRLRCPRAVLALRGDKKDTSTDMRHSGIGSRFNSERWVCQACLASRNQPVRGYSPVMGTHYYGGP